MEGHGSYSICRQQSILLLRIYGSWNIEASRELLQRISDVAVEFQGNPWAVLCDVREWGLSTPDSVAFGAEAATHMDGLGRSHTAMVIGEKWLAQMTLEDAYLAGAREVPLRFFEQELEAREWLGECGFKSTPDTKPGVTFPKV